MQFYENYANQKKWWRLAPKSEDVAPGGTKIPLGGSCARKVRKTTFFVNRTPRAPPGGSSSPLGDS